MTCARLETLDRRWIFLVMGLLVLLPLLFPLALPLTVSPPVRAFDDAIDAHPGRLHRAHVVRLRSRRRSRRWCR